MCRCTLKRAYRNVRALVSADARVLTFMASQSELDLNSLKGQNLCQAFVGVFRLLFISRFSNMGIRRFIRSLNCFGNSKRREKSS